MMAVSAADCADAAYELDGSGRRRLWRRRRRADDQTELVVLAGGPGTGLYVFVFYEARLYS